MKKKTQKVISALLLSVMCLMPLLSNVTVNAEEQSLNSNDAKEILQDPLELISLTGKVDDKDTFHVKANINNDVDNGLIKIYLYEREKVFTQEDLFIVIFKIVDIL